VSSDAPSHYKTLIQMAFLSTVSTLRGIKLPGARLSKVIFTDADISDASFRCSLMQRIKAALFSHFPCQTWFQQTTFLTTFANSTDFTNANMWGAQIVGGNYNHAVFSGADLSHATIANMKDELSCIDFSYANMRFITFQNVTFGQCSNVVSKDQTPPNFDFAILSWVDLKGTGINPDWLSKAILCGVTMPDGTINDSGCDEQTLSLLRSMRHN
jgi:uncharacterized protein YjbI with pentapeptide repeats